MSVAWYVVLERPIPSLDQNVNGQALAHAADELDALAKEIGVQPLISFFSASPADLLAFAEDEGVHAKFASMEPECWFSAEQGLKTVAALARAISVREIYGKQRIPAELREFQDVLRSASEHGISWHLKIDF